MSKAMPTVTIRLPVHLVEQIDADLLGPRFKYQIARPNRSDWIRNAVELRLAELDKKVSRKRKRVSRCAMCNTLIRKSDAATKYQHPDGEPEFICKSCNDSKLIK